jgi:hypothetical protein
MDPSKSQYQFFAQPEFSIEQMQQCLVD